MCSVGVVTVRGGEIADHEHAADIDRDSVQSLDLIPVIIFLQVFDLDQFIVCHRHSSSFQSVQ